MNSEVPPAGFRVGIVGAGGIADAHIRVLQGLPGVTLAAICDQDAAKASLLRATFDIPKAFDSLRSMLEAAPLDVIHVLVPPAAHVPVALECLEAGCHVFVEKPMATSVSECLRLQRAAQQADRQIGINHNLTYFPGILRLIQAIRERRLGRVEHVTVCYNMPLGPIPGGHFLHQKPGNLVFELGPHPISVIHRLVGSANSVTAIASGKTQLPAGGLYYETWDAAMCCERGTAQCHLSSGDSFAELWVHVLGEDGSAWADLRRNLFRISERRPQVGYMGDLRDCLQQTRCLLGDGIRNWAHHVLGTLKLMAPYDVYQDSMYASMETFYAALREGRNPAIGPEEGLGVVEICEAMVSNGLKVLQETV